MYDIDQSFEFINNATSNSGLSTNHKAHIVLQDMSQSPEIDTTHTFSYVFSDDTWYYVTLTYNGSSTYKLYVNGSYKGSADKPEISASLGVGIGVDSPYSYGGEYTVANTKVGITHIYTAELKNSQIRQNFLASHEINSDRVYGNTYTA